MNGLTYEDLLKRRAQRKLNAQEQQRLQELFAGSPELKARWVEDLSIHQMVRRLPPPEISSNFTSQVLRRIEVEQRARPASTAAPLWRKFWPRALAYGSLALALGFGGLYYQRLSARTEL